jgi:hypothetical protein
MLQHGGSRRLTWLAWVSLLLLAGAWVYTARHPWVGFHERWSQWPELLGMAAALLLVPLIGVVPGTSPGSSRGRRIAIGVAGFAAMLLLERADLLALGIVESQLPQREPSFCSYRPPLVPLLAYSVVGWLPVVLRAQAEACTLLGLRASAEAMWLRGRWLRLGFAVLRSVVLAEVVFFFGAKVCVATRFEELGLLAITPIIALLLFEQVIRRGRTVEPRYEAVPSTESTCWSAPTRPLADPVALRRGHVALRLARTIAVLGIVLGLLVLGFVFAAHVLDGRPWRLWWLLVGGLALLAMLGLGFAPRPQPDPRRRSPALSYGLSDRLRALLSELERLQALVEQGRDEAAWTLAYEIDTELASLTQQDRELLDRRHAELQRLRPALRVFARTFDSLDHASRRALHAEAIRFIACARSQNGEDPYRDSHGRPRRERLPDETLDAALRIPSSWILAGLLPCFGMVAVATALELAGLVIAVPAVILLLWVFAVVYARWMFAIAVPDHATGAIVSNYSVTFEREAARVRSSRRSVLVIATAIAAGLWALMLAAFVGAGAETLARSSELFVAASVFGAGLLGIRPLRDRLREWPAVAMVRRLHRAPTISRSNALIIELVAQRLTWARGGYLEVEALEHCGELLCAATELGRLSADDREALVERIGHAIACGSALDRRGRRALEIQLATAERLLALAI